MSLSKKNLPKINSSLPFFSLLVSIAFILENFQEAAATPHDENTHPVVLVDAQEPLAKWIVMLLATLGGSAALLLGRSDETKSAAAASADVLPEPNVAPNANTDRILSTSNNSDFIFIPKVALLLNDTDPNNNVLTITSTSNVVGGGPIVLTATNVVFAPDPSVQLNGSGSFVYTISDGFGGSDSANAFITIQQQGVPVQLITTLNGDGIATILLADNNISQQDLTVTGSSIDEFISARGNQAGSRITVYGGEGDDILIVADNVMNEGFAGTLNMEISGQVGDDTLILDNNHLASSGGTNNNIIRVRVYDDEGNDTIQTNNSHFETTLDVPYGIASIYVYYGSNDSGEEVFTLTNANLTATHTDNPYGYAYLYHYTYTGDGDDSVSISNLNLISIASLSARVYQYVYTGSGEDTLTSENNFFSTTNGTNRNILTLFLGDDNDMLILNDSYQIAQNSEAGMLTEISGGGEDDEILITNTTMKAENALYETYFTVNGDPGDDHLFIDSVTLTGSNTINRTNNEASIGGDLGEDTIEIKNLVISSTNYYMGNSPNTYSGLYVSSGSGKDTVSLENISITSTTTDSVEGSVYSRAIIFLETEDDVLTINNLALIANGEYFASPSLYVNGGDGNDEISIQDLSVTGFTPTSVTPHAARIYGGAGTDTITGDPFFSETFIVTPSSEIDIITNFTGAGLGAGDIIEIMGFGPGLDEFSELEPFIMIDNANNRTVIDLPGDELIILNGVTVSMVAADFIFT